MFSGSNIGEFFADCNLIVVPLLQIEIGHVTEIGNETMRGRERGTASAVNGTERERRRRKTERRTA